MNNSYIGKVHDHSLKKAKLKITERIFLFAQNAREYYVYSKMRKALLPFEWKIQIEMNECNNKHRIRCALYYYIYCAVLYVCVCLDGTNV